MSFSLSNFEAEINPTILERGQLIWEEHRFGELEKLANNNFRLKVFGSQPYTVEVALSGDRITQTYCTCPYDHGPICKHEVATLYEIREQDSEEEPKITKITFSSNKKKKQNPPTNFETIFKKLSAKDLRAFVGELIESQPHLENLLVSRFAHLLEKKQRTKKNYHSILKKALKSSEGEWGFIHYDQMEKLCGPAEKLLQEAQIKFVQKKHKEAVQICQALIEVLVDAIAHADDSSGWLGGLIHSSFHVFESICEKELEPDFRIELFDYCWDRSHEKKYEGWDWIWNWYGLMVQLENSEVQMERLLMNLEDRVNSPGDSFSHSFEQEQAAKYKLAILEKRNPTAAQKYLKKHVGFSSFREQLLTQYFEAEQYEKVLLLAKEGIKQDGKLSGLVSKWKEWLLKVHQAKEDTPAIIEQAEDMYIHGKHHDYFRLIKSLTPVENWEAKREDLIGKISHPKYGAPFEPLANILVEDGLMDRLIALLRNNRHFPYLIHYESLLSSTHKEELLQLYQESVYQYLAQHTGRKHYKKACGIMARMKNLGARKQVADMVEALKKAHPRKPALLQELGWL